MYKFFLYTILVIIYLGLAKTLSPSEIGVQYLQNERGFSKIVPGEEATLILVDTHATGFLIKTYYQKYRLISTMDTVEEIIVRTSREFAKRNMKFIGLSIYRRNHEKEEFLPQAPGSLYVGNREYGEWRENKKGVLKWRFAKAFKNYPNYLGWGKFRPTQEFADGYKNSATTNKPYFGLKHEFGPEGRITRENFPHFFKDERMKKVDMKTLLIDYFKENF